MNAVETHYDTIYPIVESVATDFGRKFWRYGIDSNDIGQSLWEWCLKHPNKLDTWLSEDNGERPLVVTLRNEALRLGVEAKASYLGYSAEDLSWYSKKELQKVLLPAIFDEEAWTEPPVSEDAGRSGRDPATGGNWVALLADVSRAFSGLSFEDQAMLRAFHQDGRTNKLMAEMTGVSEQAMSRQHARAIGRLHRLLGGDRPRSTHDSECECGQYVGGRRAISNAAARAAQEGYYEESA